MRRVRSVSNTVDAVRRLESPAFRRGEYQRTTSSQGLTDVSSKAFALKAQKVLAFAVRIWYTFFGARFLLLQEVGSGRTFRR